MKKNLGRRASDNEDHSEEYDHFFCSRCGHRLGSSENKSTVKIFMDGCALGVMILFVIFIVLVFLALIF